MELYQALLNRETALGVVGLGYVGLPLAVAFARKGIRVIGFDVNARKIANYQAGLDPTGELGGEAVRESAIQFTDDERQLRQADFYIVAVPTPVHADHTPDLSPLESASEIVGRNLHRGAVVVYESTVYPGATESVCVPILERASGLKCGEDFKVGYSPERVNPGDKVHRLETIRKIVSGMDAQSRKTIGDVYGIVVEAGVHPVSSIKTAEAIKVVENSQRDINIAFMNELAMMLDKMEIDTNEVVDGMNSKWNALGFRPGLVGGHCIGVDPYYLAFEAERLGYHSRMILEGRAINESMGIYVADKTIQQLCLAGAAPAKARVAVLGLTFKENCTDIRNSKAADIIRRLEEYGITPTVVDPWADPEEVYRVYGMELTALDQVWDMDCLVLAVAHKQFHALTPEQLAAMYRDDGTQKVLIDVKGIYPIQTLEQSTLRCWRL